MNPLPVYILHWNKPDWCASAVASVLASCNVPISLTVIDNGSVPALQLPGVRVLRLDSNVGYTGAANVALGAWAQLGAPWCVIGTHDLHVSPAALATMLAAGCRHPRAGILAPDYPKGDAGRGEVLSEDAFVQERSWTSGMCLMLRRECVEDIGGFDHRFFAYVEDVEFCERARRTGWKVLTVLNTVAHGLGSGQPRNRRLILANEVMLATARAGLFAAVRLLLIRGKSILAYGRRWVLRQDPHTHGELVADNWYAMRRGVRLMFRKPSIPRFEFASEPQGATVWSPSNKAAHTGPGE